MVLVIAAALNQLLVCVDAQPKLDAFSRYIVCMKLQVRETPAEFKLMSD